MALLAQPTLNADYWHIYSGDPAIDREAKTYDASEFMRTGDDAHMPIRAGLLPVRFKLRHLRGRSRVFIQDLGVKGETNRTLFEACAVGLIEIENGVLDDGSPFRLGYDVDVERKVKRLSEDTMERLLLIDEGALVWELGARVIKESFGDPLSVRG